MADVWSPLSRAPYIIQTNLLLGDGDAFNKWVNALCGI